MEIPSMAMSQLHVEYSLTMEPTACQWVPQVSSHWHENTGIRLSGKDRLEVGCTHHCAIAAGDLAAGEVGPAAPKQIRCKEQRPVCRGLTLCYMRCSCCQGNPGKLGTRGLQITSYCKLSRYVTSPICVLGPDPASSEDKDSVIVFHLHAFAKFPRLSVPTS